VDNIAAIVRKILQPKANHTITKQNQKRGINMEICWRFRRTKNRMDIFE